MISFNNVRVGDEVIVSANTDIHRVPVGEVFTVSSVANGTMSAYNINYGARGFYPADVDILELTLERLEEKLKEAQADVNILNNKISFLKETNSKTFDDIQFKVYLALKTLNKETSDLEKSKILTEIFKGNKE